MIVNTGSPLSEGYGVNSIKSPTGDQGNGRIFKKNQNMIV